MKKRAASKKLSLNKMTIAGLNGQAMKTAHGGKEAPAPRPSYDTPCIKTAICTNDDSCVSHCYTCLDCTMACPSVYIFTCNQSVDVKCPAETNIGIK